MFIVIDTNRMYSALLTKGEVFRVFELNAIFKKYEFIAPDFIFFEIGKNFDDIVKRSKLSKEELSKAFSLIKKQVAFKNQSEIKIISTGELMSGFLY